jgi:cobalt-zinc-cadmium efflux system outer membrane protein
VRPALLLTALFAAAAAGCTSERWATALDDLPRNAATAEIAERAALLGRDAPPASAAIGDPSPGYLSPEVAEERAREAAAIEQKPRVGLTDAIRLAELESRDLVASYNAIVASHGNVLSQEAYPNPAFAFTSGPMAPRGLVTGGGPHSYPVMPQASYTFTIPIVTGLRLVWARREAVANEWAARATWQVLRRNDVQGVEVAYVNALFAKENLALQEELLALAEDLDRIALRELDAGVITASDKLATEVALAQQRATLEAARQAVAGAEAQLAGTLGGVRLAVERLEGALAADLRLDPLPELEADLASTHPLIRAGELAVSAAKADTHLQRALLWPDVGLSLGYERDYLDSPPDRSFDVINFGISLNLPLFYQNQGQLETTDANLRAAQANLEFTENGLIASLRTAYSGVLAQRRQVAELREHVIPLAERALDFATKSFAAGSSRVIDVLNARQNLASARASLLAALQSLDQTVAALENLTGRRLLEIR